jgi:hypothetical protein
MSTWKWLKILKKIILNKKNSNFLETPCGTQFQTASTQFYTSCSCEINFVILVEDVN